MDGAQLAGVDQSTLQDKLDASKIPEKSVNVFREAFKEFLKILASGSDGHNNDFSASTDKNSCVMRVIKSRIGNTTWCNPPSTPTKRDQPAHPECSVITAQLQQLQSNVDKML